MVMTMTTPSIADDQTKPDECLTVACPCCDASTTHKLMLAGIPGKGDIYRCTGCNLRRLLPLPDVEAEPDDGHGMYAQQTKRFDPVYEQQVNQAAERYIDHLAGLGKSPSTMLDLGGGMGYYTRAFARLGLDVTYIDRDPISIGFAEPLNEPLGVTTVSQPAEDFAEESDNQKRFDLIFFRHVIEHCHHPGEVLKYARRMCAPSGVIVIETDNNRSLEHLLHPGAGPYWQSVYRDHYKQGSLMKLCAARPLAIDKDETHYYAFRSENLRTLVERAGWLVLDQFDYSLGNRTFWPNIPRPTSRAFWRVRGRLDLLRATAFAAAYPIMRAAGMGAGLAVFATPKAETPANIQQRKETAGSRLAAA